MIVLPAFLLGFLGSAHCAAMCGGIVSACSLGSQQPAARLYLILYNAGRIATYAGMGAVLGWLAGQGLSVFPPDQARLAGRLIAAIFLIAFGLYLTGWWPVLRRLEALGARFFRHVEPVARRFLPVRSPTRAMGLGLLWGFLPCGMVYSALAGAMASGSLADGAWFMASFGLGTMPSLLAVGLAARWFARVANMKSVRLAAGIALIGFGLVMALGLWGHSGHEGHARSGIHTHGADSTLQGPRGGRFLR